MPETQDDWLSKIGDYELAADKQALADVLLAPEEQSTLDALYRVDPQSQQKLASLKTELQIEESPTSAREVFFQQLAYTSYPTVTDNSTITMEAFLSADMFKLYQAALLEESQSPEYRRAVFLESIELYEGETLEQPLDLIMGGASATGKTFFKNPAFLAAAEHAPKRIDENGAVVENGNYVISADGGIARELSQVRGILLQLALSKGYKGIEDLNDVKLDVKHDIQAAALASSYQLNLYIPETFADNHWFFFKKSRAVKNIEYIQENHPNRNLCVGLIQADEQAIRFAGEKRAWSNRVFNPDEVKINNRNIGSESKKYGTTKPAFLGRIFPWASFWFGSQGSQKAFNTFQKQGVHAITMNNDRILVRFNNDGHLMACSANQPGAFLENERVVKAWNAQDFNNSQQSNEEGLASFKAMHPELREALISDPLENNKHINSILKPQTAFSTLEFQSIMEATKEQSIPFNYNLASHELNNSVSNTNDLLHVIENIETQYFASKGPVINIQDKKIRVFNGATQHNANPKDFYARGLQHASAMLKIAQLEGSTIDPEKIKSHLLQYNQYMSDITSRKAADFKKAKQHTIDFVGMMAWELANSRAQRQGEYSQEQYEQAFQDIKKATELYSMLEPSEDALCTVTELESGYEFQLSEKLSFAPPAQTLEQIKQTAWYIQGQKKYGLWFEQLMADDETRSAILASSPPCTTRDMPNPSNAWKETSIFTSKENNQYQVAHEVSSTRFAISSPFDIKNKAARLSMATDSMKMLLNEAELEQLAKEYITRWEAMGLEAGSMLTIPILHQTLVAPTFFYGADRDMMAVKKQANAQVQQYLAGLNMTVNGHPVRFELKQVNNCINMWHPLIIPTNNGIDDSNHL